MRKIGYSLAAATIFATVLFNSFANGRSMQHAVAKAVPVAHVFTDYQCPSCRLIEPRLSQLQNKYGAKVKFDFKNFPLPTHKNATKAAYAAEAAGLQGREASMRSELFRNQRQWSKAGDPTSLFLGYAQSLGLDKEKFLKDVNSKFVSEIVRKDIEAGRRSGVERTPTVALKGRLFVGKDIDRLEKAIDE